MSDDLETRLREALAARADARLGPRRDAPVFTPSARPGRRPVWLFPLLAAACVAAIVGGSLGAVSLLSDGHPAPATHHAPTAPASLVPVTTTVAAPSASASSSHPTSPHPTTHDVQLGAATISLPVGWVARDYAQYLTAGSTSIVSPSWCLTPNSLPVSTKQGGCPVVFGVIDPSSNGVDSNYEGGFVSNPEYCGQVSPPYRSYGEQSEDRTFGGRAADWRRWEIDCTAGQQYLIEQYVVPTGPGYVLFSETADSTVQAAMTEIATKSQLPAQDLPVRFFDEGYLRSIEHTSAGVRVAIDRIAYQDGKVVDQNPQTYSYLVPTTVFDGNRVPLKVGDLVYLSSDGRRVTQIYAE